LHLNPRTGRDYFKGIVEPEVQAVLQKYLRPGMTFYDIGANIGFFSLLAARLVGASGRVVAFEADPEVALRLREHVTRNRDAPISVEEKAVWCSSDAVLFARADTNTSPDRGLGHVVAQTIDGILPDTIRIESVSLDQYVSTSAPPDFLKCDVEGAEVEVFRGARKLLREKSPGILCEMHSDENRLTLLEQFVRLGYRCEPCGKNHVLARYAQRRTGHPQA
jgi:FkbM family methyltransferase